MSRRPNRARGRSRSHGAVSGWILGLIGAVLIIGVVGTGLYFNAHQRDVDRATGCPTDRYDSITVVLVDLTDPISPVQSAALRNALVKIRDLIPQYGRLEIYPLSPTNVRTIDPIFVGCSPGSARDLHSNLYENPELANRVWHKDFADRLAPVLTKIETLPSSQVSPIFEAIQSVNVTAFGAALAEPSQEKRLIIISDMIHFTPELSMYGGAPEFNTFKSSQYFLRVKTDLHEAKVDVYLIVRETRRDVQQPPLYKFWVEYIAAMNGYLRDWEPLQ